MAVAGKFVGEVMFKIMNFKLKIINHDALISFVCDLQYGGTTGIFV